MRNHLGRCVGGTHPVLKGINEKSFIGTIHAHHVKMARIEDFYNMENLGIQCMPRCGGFRTGVIEQHTHRFLWRNMDVTREPDRYVIQRVSFGDKPSGTIATVALRKTAEMAKDKYPQASNLLINNTYMDDIINSVDNVETAKKLTKEMETILSNGNFKIKEWIYSYDNIAPDQDIIPTDIKTAHEKVLGVVWNPITDNFCFKVKLNVTPQSKKRHPKPNQGTTTKNPKTLTKRLILSQVNSVYDPLGLASPLIVRAKILMRRLWIHNPKLD
ncbi:hypothetical protein ACROYT_G025375 [Oculina patagonica]